MREKQSVVWAEAVGAPSFKGWGGVLLLRYNNCGGLPARFSGLYGRKNNKEAVLCAANFCAAHIRRAEILYISRPPPVAS